MKSLVSGALALTLLSGAAFAADSAPATPDPLAFLVPLTDATNAAFLSVATPIVSPLAALSPPAAPAPAPAPVKHHRRHKKHHA